jgi:oxidase EvaA
MTLPAKGVAENWFRELLQREAFSMTHMPLAASGAWALREGAIRHRSGRFFSVVGIRAVREDGAIVEQPLLEQQEIGTLAFMVRHGRESVEVLVQAKVEPGNVGMIQLAPSFQATASNAARIHGGTPPPLHEWFADAERGRLVASTLQSEQGSRFLGKRNRNCTLLVADEVEHGRLHRWLPARELCALLAEDHLVNTDARSSLVCSDWYLLAGGTAFRGDGFAEELRASHELPDTEAWQALAAVLAELEKPAPWRAAPKLRPLDRLGAWQMGDEGPQPLDGGSFRLRHIHVHALSREVPEWDQPIVQSTGRGEVVLPIGRWRGVPHFLFRAVTEPGFGQRIELTPALTMEPGGSAHADAFMAALMAEGREIISCLQSEEGGRFLFDENRYALLDVGQAMQPPEGCHWLSLAQVRTLLARGESLTNEARSALSLLLTWL